jgi:hypothetical protein
MVPGSVAVGAENYHHNILVICPVCHDLHIVDPERWTLNEATLTISPSVLVINYRGICHWNLTNGEFIIHGDSTAKPRGESALREM